MSSDPVVLLHGLWMNALVMRPLGWRLRGCGFHPCYFSYASTRANPQENADALQRYLQDIPGARVHFVCHSLGGLVALNLFARHPRQRPGRIVLLGSPVQGSAVARRMAGHRPLRTLLGRSVERGLLQGAPPPADHDLGLIAGTLGVGGGRLFGPMEGVHDGVVNLAETRLPGAADHLCIHTNHLGLLFAPGVAKQACQFLKHGRFQRH